MNIIKKALFLVGLLFFPVIVFAAGGANVSTSSLTLDQGGSTTFTISATNAAGRFDISSSNTGVATVNKSSEWIENGSVTVAVNGVSAGSTTIKVAVNASTFDEEVIKTTYTINVTVRPPKSTVADLSALTVNGNSVSGFNPNTTTYNLGTMDVASINIGATKADANAIITSGTGVKNLNYGSNSFTVTVKAEAGNTKNYVINVTRPDNRSADNYLANLTLSQGSISFSKTTQKYNITVDNSVSTIAINATANDSKSQISGTGTKILKVYSNTFTVTVTAENGQKRNYTINVIRKDADGNTSSSNVSNDSSLKDLTVEGYSLGFNPNVYEYSIDVVSSVSEITINAVPNSDKAKVSGTGTFVINPGLNEKTITVVAESGDYTDYFIKINRLDEENIASSVLTSLVVNGLTIDVNGDSKTFLIGVDSSVSKLELSYKTSSNTAKYEVSGNDKISEGINVVTIKVSDDGAGENTYTLLVNKLGNETLVNSLAIDEFTSDVVMNSYYGIKVKKALLEVLKKTDYKLNLNKVNEYNGLLFGVQLDKNVTLDDDIELSISKIGNYEKSVVYASNVPKNALIKLHVDEKLNGKSVYLYSYNLETKKYILIKEKEKINDEYITFKSDGSYIYLVSEQKITDKGFIFQLILYLLFFLLGALIIVTVYVFYKRNKLKMKK